MSSPKRGCLHAVFTLAFVPLRYRFLTGVTLVLVLVVLAAGLVMARPYLSNEPSRCQSCHVMAPEYATWEQSTHHAAATCNDCHVPPGTAAATTAFKARTGLLHVTVNVLGAPARITASPESVAAIEANCRRCHAQELPKACTLDKRCAACHASPHGSVDAMATQRRR